MSVSRGSDLQAGQFFFFSEKITSGHSNIWQGTAIYYLDNLEQLLNLSESWFIDLLSNDNDIYLAEFWWGLKLDNNVFSH